MTPKGIRWLKNSNRHKKFVLPDGRHVWEEVDHGGFIHISVHVSDKNGRLWVRMENKYPKEGVWTTRYVDLARTLACQVYSDPHKRMDEFERRVDKLTESRRQEPSNRNQGGTV